MRGGRAADPRHRAQPAAGRGGRASRRRGHAPGRARRPRGVSAAERALATIELGAIERNCARLPKPLCAVVKADALRPRPRSPAAALAGGADLARRGRRRGGGRAARQRHRRADPRDGRADAATSCARRVDARGRRRGLDRGGGRGRAARARQARHRDGPARHQGPRAGAAAGRAAERRSG